MEKDSKTKIKEIRVDGGMVNNINFIQSLSNITQVKIINPYNTYLNKGLPPGPINSPGREALIAAASPIKTDFFYFVSDGNGRHIFNKTYKEHLKSK